MTDDEPKFPFVQVYIGDLIADDGGEMRPGDTAGLLKRCSIAARSSGFVPWAAIIAFNLEALSYNDFVCVWNTAIEWFDCDILGPNV
jgi:hypothetical protein